MNEITMAILAVIIFWSGHILGYITGGIHRNKRKEELENRFNEAVQNVIDHEMKDQKRYVSEPNENRDCPLSRDEIYKLLNAIQNKELNSKVHGLKREVDDTLEKIRADIEQLPTKTRTNWNGCCPDLDYPEIEYVDVTKNQLLSIIDKREEEVKSQESEVQGTDSN